MSLYRSECRAVNRAVDPKYRLATGKPTTRLRSSLDVRCRSFDISSWHINIDCEIACERPADILRHSQYGNLLGAQCRIL